MDVFRDPKKIREKYEINGEHEKLGRELGMAEFKGYTIATLRSIDERLDAIQQQYMELRNKVEWNQKILYMGLGALTLLMTAWEIFKYMEG